MPDWVVPLVVGFGGGLSVTLLRLRHERGDELRSRMLEAADDFVAAYTAAREATSRVATQVSVRASFAEGDVPGHVREEWRAEEAAAIGAARDACDALGGREPRIALLFGRYSLTHRNAMLAEMSLDSLMFEVSALKDAGARGEESVDIGRDHRRDADRALNSFSDRAREAILAPPWSVRPLVARGRLLRRRTRAWVARVFHRGQSAP